MPERLDVRSRQGQGNCVALDGRDVRVPAQFSFARAIK
jgi:hypothetical protein